MSPKRSFALAVVSVLSLAVGVRAQYTERVDVWAIEVQAIVRNEKGEVPRDLKPSDFELRENGKLQRIIGVTYNDAFVEPPAPVQAAAPAAKPVAPPPQPRRQRADIVVYLQQSLATTHGIRAAAESLVKQVPRLAANADVEVVTDFPSPRVLLARTHDAAALQDFFEKLAKNGRGFQQQINLRMRASSEPAMIPALDGSTTPQSRVAAASASAEEQALIHRQQNSLLTWMSRYPRMSDGGTRLLIFVSDGFEFDSTFYDRAYNTPPTVLETGEIFVSEGFDRGDRNPQEHDVTEAFRGDVIARSLAAEGWTVLSVAAGYLWNSTSTPGSTEIRGDAKSKFDPFQGSQPLVQKALDPLLGLAEETGGMVETNPDNIGKSLQTLSDRVTITYQVNRARDGKVRKVELRSTRPGLTVSATKWSVLGSPETVGLARATSLAFGGEERGELPVNCTIVRAARGESVTARVDLAPIEGLRKNIRSGTIRFYVAVAPRNALPFTATQTLDALDLSTKSRWEAAFPLMDRRRAPVAVVAEEVSTGVWGGATCGASEPGLLAEAGAASGSAGPARELPAELAAWLPLKDAVEQARTQDRLVLLYVRGREGGMREEKWLSQTMSREQVRRTQDAFVTARSSWNDDALSAFEGAQQFFGTGRSRMVVLDPAGARVMELGDAFGDADRYGSVLRALRANAPRFVAAARRQAEGKMAEAVLLRAQGLFESGAVSSADDGFYKARDLARREKNAELEQHAELGIATVHLARGVPSGLAEMRSIANRAVSPRVAANAWLIIAAAEKSARRNPAAKEAYGNVLRLAEKGSEPARVARQNLALLGVAVPEEEVASAGELRLSLPAGELLFGDIVAGASVPVDAARVEFLLDGRTVVTDDRAPFSATLKLGGVPRPHTIGAIAYDSSGNRLAGQSTEVNRRHDGLSVRIVDPVASRIESAATVTLDVAAPAGVTVAGVDLYWNDTKLASLTQPPYKFDFRLPQPNASGYLRAVARDVSGATAEDARMINSAAGAAEQVSVNAVELYAVVQTRGGENVRGLTAADFRVKEDGVPVNVELRGGESDPITIGVVIDVSGSMRTAMAETIDHAREFVRTSLSQGDQVFVVAFDDAPHLLQPLTSDLQRADAAIDRLAVRGGSAVWDSLLFSIAQFRSGAGKRALVVFTDGRDSASRASLENVRAYAQQAGVPIYIVYSNTPVELLAAGSTAPPPGPAPPAARAGLGSVANLPSVVDTTKTAMDTERLLRELSHATGGSVFSEPKKSELRRIFTQVRDDTRAEYLLTFNSSSTRAATELRKISVDSLRPGVVVRAPSGYYPK